MKYSGKQEFIGFNVALAGIEAKYGGQGRWIESLAKIDQELAGKCQRQLNRVYELTREEAKENVALQSYATMVKGIERAMQVMDAAKAPEVDKAYVTTKTPDGIKVRVYADRAAIPDTDGMGDVAMVSAEDLVKFIPDDVIALLKAFPGASVSRILDQRKDSSVSSPEPSGFTPTLTRGRGKGRSSKAMQAIIDMPDSVL